MKRKLSLKRIAAIGAFAVALVMFGLDNVQATGDTSEWQCIKFQAGIPCGQTVTHACRCGTMG